jgi:hypothetical protein
LLDALGQLGGGGAVGAPERKTGQHDEHHPTGECTGWLALMPGQGAEDRQARLKQVERHAGKRVGPVELILLTVNMSYDFYTCHTAKGPAMRVWIWSFVQQKGGSGKSTICTNLAVCSEDARRF